MKNDENLLIVCVSAVRDAQGTASKNQQQGMLPGEAEPSERERKNRTAFLFVEGR
jgi:hypothetical protein